MSERKGEGMSGDNKKLRVAKDTVEKAGYEPGTEGFDKALALLVSGMVGPSIERIQAFTGLPRRVVAEVSHAARKQGIWKGDHLEVEWLDPENGGIAFVMDVLVVEGMMARV